ncbi:MAG: DUF1592 domain-containing protein [Pirellulales bacterium]
MLLIAIAAFVPSPVTAGDAAQSFQTDVLPILQRRCAECHGDDVQEAGIHLAKSHTAEELAAAPHTWFRALDQVAAGNMPPDGEPPLSTAEQATIVGWIEGDLTDSLVARQRRDGRSKFRRLSRAEYLNTFEDLFGYRPNPDPLPADGRVDGYTKVSDALSLSSEGAYGYSQVARELVDRWVLRPTPKLDNTITRAEAMESGQSKGHSLVLDDGWIVSFNTDDTSGRLKYGGVRTPGVHKLRMHVYAYQSDEPLLFGVYAGKTLSYPQEIELLDVLEAPAGKPTVVETELYLKERAGIRLIPFGIGVQVPKNSQASECRGPGLAVQWMEVEEPARPIRADQWLTADLPEDLRAAMRNPRVRLGDKGSYRYGSLTEDEFVDLMGTTLTRVGARVLRRDLTAAEMTELLSEVRQGLQQDQPLQQVFLERVTDLLASPEFFCVIESPGELSEFELAARLSYFLWNSTPDEQLLQVARAGKLRDPAVLRAQTDRLLDDPRSDRFVEDFLDQWLDLHAIDDTTPDSQLYPEYDDVLKFSSLQETRATFRRMLRENRSVGEFIAPRQLLVNARLAEHYGVEGVSGAELRPVNVPPGSPFGGLWTQPAILKVTADGSSTSPVKRGVWVSERLLGVPISPPPPNIEPINPDTRGATTLREQLALHSAHRSCSGCHKQFDPFGFALENFDVMGQYREHYRLLDAEVAALPAHRRQGAPLWLSGLAVDGSGVTPEGESFADIVELREHLVRHPEKLAWGVAWHLATYATGAVTDDIDRRAVQAIVDASAEDGYRLRSTLHALVQSELFRWK